MMTKDEFISISRKHGLEIEDDTTNLTVDVFYNKFKYLSNEEHFNLIRLMIKRHCCLSWKYGIENDELVHQNHGTERIRVTSTSDLENLYTEFDKFIKKAEKTPDLSR